MECPSWSKGRETAAGEVGMLPLYGLPSWWAWGIVLTVVMSLDGKDQVKRPWSWSRHELPPLSLRMQRDHHLVRKKVCTFIWHINFVLVLFSDTAALGICSGSLPHVLRSVQLRNNFKQSGRKLNNCYMLAYKQQITKAKPRREH